MEEGHEIKPSFEQIGLAAFLRGHFELSEKSKYWLNQILHVYDYNRSEVPDLNDEAVDRFLDYVIIQELTPSEQVYVRQHRDLNSRSINRLKNECNYLLFERERLIDSYLDHFQRFQGTKKDFMQTYYSMNSLQRSVSN